MFVLNWFIIHFCVRLIISQLSPGLEVFEICGFVDAFPRYPGIFEVGYKVFGIHVHGLLLCPSDILPFQFTINKVCPESDHSLFSATLNQH